MNSRNSHIMMRLLPMLGMLCAVAVGSASLAVFGPEDRSASMISALIAVLLLVASLVVSAVFLYHGVLRVPATARTARIREIQRSGHVWAVDMDRSLREWLHGHLLAGAQDTRISRFGGNVSADEAGLTFWAGTGSEPARAAFLAWADIREVIPPAAGDFIGASTPQTFLTIRLVGSQPELRILFLLGTPPAIGADDYSDVRDAAAVLERLRGDAQSA